MEVADYSNSSEHTQADHAASEQHQIDSERRGSAADAEREDQNPTSSAMPAQERTEASKLKASLEGKAGEESSITVEAASSESETAVDWEPQLQGPVQPNPFEQLGSLSNLMSQIMPGFDHDASFDVGEMRARFGNEEHTGSFASFEVKPGGMDGELTDNLPVPVDLQSIWQQMNAIELPKVVSPRREKERTHPR